MIAIGSDHGGFEMKEKVKKIAAVILRKAATIRCLDMQ